MQGHGEQCVSGSRIVKNNLYEEVKVKKEDTLPMKMYWFLPIQSVQFVCSLYL